MLEIFISRVITIERSYAIVKIAIKNKSYSENVKHVF